MKELLRVKLQKELVRKAAFQSDGRLTPKELASAQGWSVEHALNVLKNLAAEDPERMTLHWIMISGEVYSEFADILLAPGAAAISSASDFGHARPESGGAYDDVGQNVRRLQRIR